MEKQVTVAVVDDHQLVLDGITAHLSSQDCLRVVVSEPTWVGLLAHPEFPPDVVVLDLHLKDQITIGTKLRELVSAGARVVVTSRRTDAATINSVLIHGAHGFVPKSNSADELVAAIRCVAGGTSRGEHQPRAPLARAEGAPGPQLGNRERKALLLFASGRPMKDVAIAMSVTEGTAKSYIKRARRKYSETGIDISSRASLRQRAVVEGWLGPE